jgi:hypothetical protein
MSKIYKKTLFPKFNDNRFEFYLQKALSLRKIFFKGTRIIN